jgi:ABC-type Fe3+ transport system substrate-binding protein
MILFPAPYKGAKTETLRILSATDLDQIMPLLRGFQGLYSWVTVEYVEYAASQQLYDDVATACRNHRPVADLILNSASDLQVKLVNDGCARPASLAEVRDAPLPDWARWRNELFGLTYEPAVIVYRKAAFTLADPPNDRFSMLDLLRQSSVDYRGRLGTYDIRVSGVGYLLAAQDSLQASTFGRMMENFNAAHLVCCTAHILDGIENGSLVLGYNVLGAYALERIRQGGDQIGIVFPKDYTLIFSRSAFVYRHANNSNMAERFIAFALSSEGRRISHQESTLLNPIDGEQGLRRLYNIPPERVLHLRPIELSSALLVSQDRSRHDRLLKEWTSALGNNPIPDLPTLDNRGNR